MKREITITKKNPRKGEDGHKVVSVRKKDVSFLHPFCIKDDCKMY